MDVDAYLSRIGVSGPITPGLENLERLQRAHLTSVPFENLDVFARRGVRTDDEWTVPKVVEQRRGGWCFELNGAFAALLEALGYEVIRHGATVLFSPISPMPTHLTLEVRLDRPYLVDVGFGDSFIRPLPLDSPGPHDGGSAPHGFVHDGDNTTLTMYEGPDAVPQFEFATDPFVAADFDEASDYLQTHPDLRWTTTRFATRLLDGGPDRVTLLEDRIKFRRDGIWSERPIAPEEFEPLLDEWFAMTP